MSNKMEHEKFIIPLKTQHHLVKHVSHNIKSQKLATIGGLILYPSIYLLTPLKFVGLYTPVCVGHHFIATRKLYSSLNYLLCSNYIDHNNKITYDDIKEYKNVYVDKDSNLCFRRKPNYFTGININKETKIDPLFNIFQNKNKNKNKMELSAIHLQNDIRNQIDNIMIARRQRFRYPLFLGTMTAIISSAMMIIARSGSFSRSFLYSATILSYPLGIVTGIGTTPQLVKHETNKLFDIIGRDNLISKDFVHMYDHDYDKDMYIYVNIFGNLVVSKEKPLFRQHMKKKIK